MRHCSRSLFQQPWVHYRYKGVKQSNCGSRLGLLLVLPPSKSCRIHARFSSDDLTLNTDWAGLCCHLQYGWTRSPTRWLDATCHAVPRRADATHCTGKNIFTGSVGAAACPSAQLKVLDQPDRSKTPRRSMFLSRSMLVYTCQNSRR